MSGRRQPARQARTNPPRNAASATRPFGGRGSLLSQQDDRAAANASPGFFPAITHFTDSISALPKEMIRHYTMLKEVDAKICGPEDALKQLMNVALKTPPSPRKYPASGRNPEQYSDTATRANPSAAGSISGNGPLGVLSHEEINSQHGAPTTLDIAEFSRRQLFLQLRMVMGEMLTTLDEKNHVMSTATDALNKQLKRCESSFPYINDEISEETRLGNPRHWAYLDKTAEKKGTTAGERTRRDAAAANNLAASATLTQEGELAALRSEARREAVAARKQRAQHVDSDFDDSRGAKKPPAQPKSRKMADVNSIANGSGLGITAGQPASVPNPPAKRRRVEKPISAGLISGTSMERSLSAVYGTTAATSRGGGVSPRETPALEITKKRARAGTITNGTTRRRTGTNASAANSPLLASSPVIGTFTVAAKGGHSPAVGAVQRSQSTRGRQNSNQTSQEPSRSQNPSSSSTKHANGSGPAIPQLDGPSGPRETRTLKDLPSKLDTSIPTDPDHRTSSRSHDRPSLKREAPSPPPPRARADRPPSISTTTRTSGKASKAATPLSSSFPEPSRPRSGRNVEPTAKRSHKKGAGILAQQQLLAAQQAAQEEDGEGSAAEDGEDDHEGEPRYCYCNGFSYGEMVACDGEGCEREWFHLECAGLPKPPKGKWFCDGCKRKGKA